MAIWLWTSGYGHLATMPVGGDGALAALDRASPEDLDAPCYVVVVREAVYHQHGGVAVGAQHLGGVN